MAIPLKFSEFYRRRTYWTQFDLDAPLMWDAIGPSIAGGTKNYTQIRSDTMALAKRSPLAFALLVARNKVLVGHSLSQLPADPCDPQDTDGLPALLFGDDLGTCTALCFSSDAFKTKAYNVEDMSVIAGPTRHGADPPVVHHGPHAVPAPGIHAVNARPLLVIHSSLAVKALREFPKGETTMTHFYSKMIAPLTDHGVDPDELDDAEVMFDWFLFDRTTHRLRVRLRDRSFPFTYCMNCV